MSVPRKRAEKTTRRKKLLAERKKAAIADGLQATGQRMRRLSAAPIDECLMQEGMLEAGGGMLVLTRRPVIGHLAMSAFLLDTLCLGVKNAFFLDDEASQIEETIEAMDLAAPLHAVEPAFARKLLHDLVAWSRSIGIAPHKDYFEAEALFGEVSTAGRSDVFEFGMDGRPLLVPGPEDTPAQIRRWMGQLGRTLGDDGFDVDDDEADDDAVEPFDDAEFEARAGLYDPDLNPDPTEWMALDEGERLMRIEAHHRLAGIPMPDGPLHALCHIIVENQIALGDATPVRRTLARLIAEGLDRHEAIHALGMKIAGQFIAAATTGNSDLISTEAYFAEVEALTAEGWRREMESDEDDEGNPT